MIHVPINLSGDNITCRTVETLKVSIPFSQGEVFNTEALLLVNQDDKFYPCQLQVLTSWPDKSVKWLQLHFRYISSPDLTSEQLYLSDKTSKTKLESVNDELLACNISINDQVPNTILINTGAANFKLSTSALGSFTRDETTDSPLNNSELPCYSSNDESLLLTDADNCQYLPIITGYTTPTISNDAKTISTQLTFSGIYQNKTGEVLLNFSAEIEFFAGSAKTLWRMTIHNPKGMVHNNGKWDLGNHNSTFFKSLNIHVFAEKINDFQYQINSDTPWQKSTANTFELFQASSGGENWQSANHVDHTGKVNIAFNGYSVALNGEQEIIKGRAQPSLQCKTPSEHIGICVDNFWQNFPKKLSLSSQSLTIGLFPEQDNVLYELQPGEKKSHTFSINYAHTDSLNELNDTIDGKCSPVTDSNITNKHQVHVFVDSSYIAQTNTVPFFSIQRGDQALNDLINQGLTSDNNFFTKRETIDEFGWRNFGDMFADHEAIEYKGESELISHYNNQYDPLYGFLRQYLTTGDLKWLTLANDLAAHVKDIDIYHTTQDRAEYNGGLFWHTDHYLPAETASHRTYSEKQSANAYQDHAGGGGPGGQHCYTTGLMLHYFITGDTSSKQAAITISQWVTNVYEGSHTVTDFLLAIKNKTRIDLKNIFTGKYPLDRGTGHYVIALIDSFELTGKQQYLDQASLVIKNTVHPEDNVADRDLLNVEVCWYYTVFFQAVYRFLQAKEFNNQQDSSFDYARLTLLHYGKWMLKNEAPYLHKPEILEYPNHTWAAQDIRKANILFFGAYYADSEEMREAFINKADSLYQYVTNELSTEPTRDTTRILSILMQNHGVRSFCLNNQPKLLLNNKKPEKRYAKVVKSGKQNVFDALMVTLNKTSVASEIDWLRKRVSKVDHLLTKLGK